MNSKLLVTRLVSSGMFALATSASAEGAWTLWMMGASSPWDAVGIFSTRELCMEALHQQAQAVEKLGLKVTEDVPGGSFVATGAETGDGLPERAALVTSLSAFPRSPAAQQALWRALRALGHELIPAGGQPVPWILVHPKVNPDATGSLELKPMEKRSKRRAGILLGISARQDVMGTRDQRLSTSRAASAPTSVLLDVHRGAEDAHRTCWPT